MLSSNTSAVSGDANYIEDVFSTYLYTGNGSTQTITNNIDLSTKGGLVWTKCRNAALTGSHRLTDTARGAGNSLVTSNTNGNEADSTILSAFTSTGFTLGSSPASNNSGNTFASWTFRKQPKFFDIVTWTGDGSNPRTISHNLGSTPGCIIVKETNAAGSWAVWQRSLGDGYRLILNSTNASTNVSAADWFGTSNSTITSTGFSVGSNLNTSGRTLVAYLFAHDAGGFGLTGTDNVISCGSFTTDGAGSATVNLGYEPQYLLVKATGVAQNWFVFDVMRGLSYGAAVGLSPNVTDPDSDFGPNTFFPTATGFSVKASLSASAPYIYIAIRRGPMKVPTDATKVFKPVAYTGTNVDNRLVDTGIVTDMTMARIRTTSAGSFYTADRLRGDYFLATGAIDAEATDPDSYMTPTSGYGNSFSAMNGFGVGNDPTRQLNQSSTSQLAYAFRRAPVFFDEVCYTGTGSATTVTHNLGTVPEMMIVKRRSSTTNWDVYSSALTATKVIYLNSDAAAATSSTFWNDTAPTSSVFTVATSSGVNTSGATYVAYLFATCAGVSKVGSYTGTNALTTINCGFAGGARFVLIKRTDTTSDWFVWDTARGMVTGTDPSLSLNTSSSELNADSVYTVTTGFQLLASPYVDVNTFGGSYIFLAIA